MHSRADVSRRGRFGVTAFVLNLIPVAGFAFSLTSTVGAAIWAGKLEKSGGKVNESNPKVDRDEAQVEL